MKIWAFLVGVSMVVHLCAADLKGYFMTHVGESGRQSIVEFFERDGKYYAYGFANVDGSGPKKDINNQNPELRDRVDKGTVFIYDLVPSGKDHYKGGTVYNYDSGKEYYIKISLEDGGKTLKLRASVDSAGFVGETKVWKRLTTDEEAKYFPEKPDFSVVEQSLKELKERQKDK
ncbi:hypothetical protein CCZ01_04315 [Helicobacter monodelphidis]|uniref:DUF2147 domain-containing protein n=1 Tax=Helicobacter sp. 15-1451 TaxID=2004995 RepID=UPI000DCC0332|nr:DUF2147 domain-containing protein [Helicobacter sp. 15-1451]RAX58037.1 hypothetical protein CCZ01_04315 [Helicobacter sp. 15-1451]